MSIDFSFPWFLFRTFCTDRHLIQYRRLVMGFVMFIVACLSIGTMKWTINVTYVNSHRRILHYRENRSQQFHVICSRIDSSEPSVEMKIKISVNLIRFVINWFFALHICRQISNPIVLPKLSDRCATFHNSFKMNGLTSALGNSIRNGSTTGTMDNYCFVYILNASFRIKNDAKMFMT